MLRRVVAGAPRFLRPGGTLLLELGGEQADAVGSQMDKHGYGEIEVWADEDGDVRGIEAMLLAGRLGPVSWPQFAQRDAPDSAAVVWP
jgi:release factor glutamine methyltransferase